MRVSDNENANAETHQRKKIQQEAEFTTQPSPLSSPPPLIWKRLSQRLSNWWGKINHRLPARVRGVITGALLTAVVVIAAWRWIGQQCHNLASEARETIIGSLIALVIVLMTWWRVDKWYNSLEPVLQSGFIGGWVALVVLAFAWQPLHKWYNDLGLALQGGFTGGLVALVVLAFAWHPLHKWYHQKLSPEERGAIIGSCIAAFLTLIGITIGIITREVIIREDIVIIGMTTLGVLIIVFLASQPSQIPLVARCTSSAITVAYAAVVLIIVFLAPYLPRTPLIVRCTSSAIAVGCAAAVLVINLPFVSVVAQKLSSKGEGVIGAIVGISIVLIVVLLFFPFFDTLSLAPTPMPSVVKAFLVTKRNSPIMVEPGTTITATVQEIVQIKVKVSTAYEEQEEDLMFTWYTCRKGGNPVRQSVGNSEILYVAPSEPGSDCIRVVVEKGGTLLDRSEIFVDVQK